MQSLQITSQLKNVQLFLISELSFLTQQLVYKLRSKKQVGQLYV